MSEASDKLAKSRRAIMDHIARGQRRHDPRVVSADGTVTPGAADSYDYEPDDAPAGSGIGGWLAHMGRAVRIWWRHHPAQMVVELTSPLMRSYARRKPVQLLAISVATGAVLTLARPWRLISISALVIAILKSSQLSGLLMAAMSAADYPKDDNRPE